MKSDFTISLARIQELPEVMASFRNHRTAANTAQKRILKTLVDDALRQILDHIMDVQIPLEAGKVSFYVVEGYSDDENMDSLLIAELPPAPARRLQGVTISCILTDDLMAGVNRNDLLDQDSITQHVYNQLIPILKQAVKAKHPDGNVKVQVKRERCYVEIKDGPNGEPVEVENTIRRHLVVTVSIPATAGSSASGSRASKKSAARKRRASSSKQARIGRSH